MRTPKLSIDILKYAVLLAIMLLSWNSGICQYVQAKPLQLDPSVKIGKLSNGFTYYLKVARGGKTAVQFVVRAGYNQETKRQLYMSHLLEHMAFRSTKNFENPLRYFEERGVVRGNDMNAVTANDRVVYYANLPPGDDGLLRSMLQFYRDCAENIVINHEACEKEKLVVLEECRRSANQSSTRTIIQQHLIGASEFSRRMDFQEAELVKTYKYSMLIELYNTWYVPKNEAIIIVGDINLSETEKRIQEMFSDLKSPHRQATVNPKNKPFNWKFQTVNIRDAEVRIDRIEAYFKFESRPIQTALDFKKQVANRLINEMFNARCIQFNKQSEYAVDLSGGYEHVVVLGPEFDAFKVSFSIKSGKKYDAIKEVFLELQRMQSHGFSETELLQAKGKLDKEFLGSPNNYWFANSLVDNFVSATPVLSSTDAAVLFRQCLKDIDSQYLNQQTTPLLTNRDNLNVFLITGNLESLDGIDNEKMIEILDLTDRTVLQPYVATKSITNDVTYLLSPDAIHKLKHHTKVQVSKHASAQIASFSLPNGIEVFIKPLDNEGDNSVVLRTFNGYNTSRRVETNRILQKYAHHVINESGLAGIKSDILRQFFDRNGVESLGAYNGNKGFGFQARTNKKGLDIALQAIYLYSTAPLVSSSVLSKIVEEAKQSIMQKEIARAGIRADTVGSLKDNSNEKLTESLIELDRLDSQSVANYFKARFTATEGTKLVIAGNINLDSTVESVITFFGNIPYKSFTLDEQAKEIVTPTIQNPENVRIYSMESSEAEVRFSFKSIAAYSLEKRISLDIISSYLNVQLFDRLRRTESGIYNISVDSHLNRADNSTYELGIYFVCDAANVDRLAEAVKSELRNICAAEIEANLFARLKNTRKVELEQDMRTSLYWVTYISNQLKSLASLSEVFHELSTLNSLSARTVRGHANEILSFENLNSYINLPKKIAN